MQQIERYGVIALVFFLITIVAVSFWGDSKSPGFWSRLTGRGKQEPVVEHILPPVSSTATALTPPAPLDLDPQRIPVAEPPAAAVLTAPQTDAKGAGFAAAPGELVTPQPSPPASVPAPATNEYVVQKGDSLALIARRTLGKESRWTEIAALNPGLTPKNLKLGSKLSMPADATALAAPAAAVKKAEATPLAKKTEAAPKAKPAHSEAPEKKLAAGPSCKVQKGDTFKLIARRELGSDERWKEIAELNPGVTPSKLAVGQVLRLPEHSQATEVASLAALPASNKPRVR